MNPEFTLSVDDIKITQQNALELFYSGIKSPQTKHTMEGNLKYFLLKVCKDLLDGDLEQRAQQFVDITRDDQTRAKNIVIAYLKHLVDRTKLDKTESYYIRPSYVPNKIKPIKKLLTMNDLGLPWNRINAMFPERQNTHKGRGYTREEIKRLLAFAGDLDTEFIILAASSGGLRNGTWDGISWGDILPVYEVNGEYKMEFVKGENGTIACAAMVVHAGTDAQYETLISLEAWEKLEEYKIEWKRKMKRFPVESDPLLVSGTKKPIPTTDTAIRARIHKLLVDSGLRGPLTEGLRRHQVPATHGFRRYWDKVMMQTKRKKGTLSALVTKEYLMGHKGIVKTDKNYFWVTILEQVPEYLEAMNELMISDEVRLKCKLAEEKQRSFQLETHNEKLKDALFKVSELEAKVQRMEKYQIKK